MKRVEIKRGGVVIRRSPLKRKRTGPPRRKASGCRILRCNKRIATAELCSKHAVERCDVLARAICRAKHDRCQRCGSASALQWSHHLSRKFKHLRWDPRNATMHCSACHTYLTHNPALHADWIRRYVGVEAAERLLDEAYGPIDERGIRPGARKFTTFDLAAWLLLLEATTPEAA